MLGLARLLRRPLRSTMAAFSSEAAPEVVEHADGALVSLTLNRPKALNSLNLNMVRLLKAALARYAADDARRLLLLGGAGGQPTCGL